MRVRLLGGFEVEGIAERDLGSRKGRRLLEVLAVAGGRPVSVDHLAEVLWGDDQPTRPADQVGVLVSRLRGVVGADRILRTDAGYALAADWSDVGELAALATSAAAAMEQGRLGAARAAAGAALALVRGPLLPQEEGPWIEAERMAVAAEVTRVRRLAVEATVAAGDHDAAAALADQALAADPYDEVLLRSLMSAHLAAGRPASALAAYARVRARLAEDLGVPPSARTEELHARALAAADGDATADRATVERGTPLGVVGRAAELAELDAALSGVAAGGSALVIVEGDAGIGKTTLVEAWAGRVGDQTIVLAGRCDEMGRDLPLQPVLDALAEHLRRLGPEAAAVLLGDEAVVLAPALGPVAREPMTAVSDAEAGRARLFQALVTVLARAGEGAPAVLILEDLHLAGVGTVAWLAFMRRRGHRTLVVVTTRRGEADALDATRRLRLGPLDLHAVTELVGEERAASLHQRSGGHPLLLAALRDAPDDELPSSLLDSVARRVDSLGSDVGATLRVAAILGHNCDLELIALVQGAPIVEVLTALETAARAGLVVEVGSRFAFRHELVREALAAATGAARRALVHQQAAHLLAGRKNPDPLAVAVHARAGGDDGLAASWLVTAASAAAARYDLDTAEEQLTAAIELTSTADGHIARARVRMSRNELGPAARDAAAAIALDGGPAALEVAGWIAYYQRRYDEARAYADEAAARAEGDPVRISALALAGRVRHGEGDLAGAVVHLSSVGDGPPAVRGLADVWLAQARNHQGRPTDALAALARPMVDPGVLAHPWAPLHLRFNRVIALGQLGRVAEALRVVEDLDRVVIEEGAVGLRFQAPAANVGSWVLRWSGRADEADERNLAAAERTGGLEGPSTESVAEGHYVALLDLADGCELRDDWARLAELVDRLTPVDTWTGTMAWHQRHRLGLLRARLALAAGDAATAAQLSATVTEDAAARGARRYELLSRAVTGLADRSVPDAELDRVIDGLGTCAVLDGWGLVGALARSRGVDAWRSKAEDLAATVVANAGDRREEAARLVERRLRA